MHEGFRDGPPGKESAYNSPGSFPGSGRPPGERNGNPRQHFARETLGQIRLAGYSPGVTRVRHALATETPPLPKTHEYLETGKIKKPHVFSLLL